MSFTPKPLQTLFLWALISNGGKAFKKDIKPDLDKKQRDPLVKAGINRNRNRPKTRNDR